MGVNQQINSVDERASFALTYSGGNLVTVVKVVDRFTYTTTLSYTGSQLDSVSTPVRTDTP